MVCKRSAGNWKMSQKTSNGAIIFVSIQKEKCFLVTAPDQSPVSASFKSSDENFAELPEREGFKPAPYMARHKWIYVDDIKRLPAREWKAILQEAHALVRAKPKAKKK